MELYCQEETEVLGEKLPQCHFDHHMSYGISRGRTEASAVRGQRLTARGMVRHIKIRIISKGSCRTAQKTLPLGYRKQEVSATCGNKPCLV